MRAAATLMFCTLTAFLCAVPASARHMTDFDLNKLDSWSDAIAVCDITHFLLTDPGTIPANSNANGRTAAYKQLNAPTSNFFSDAMHLTFEHVQKAGLVTPQSYDHSRQRFAALMLAAYDNATLADKRFLADQMQTCYRLAAHAGVKLTPAMRAKQ